MGVIVLVGAEFFFRANAHYGWIQKPYFSPEITVATARPNDDMLSDLDLSYTESLTPGIQLNSDEGSSVYEFRNPSCGNSSERYLSWMFHCPSRPIGCVVRMSKSLRSVFSVTYSADENCRRRVPASVKSSNRYLVFLGCSFTFGEGVEDSETFASRVVERVGNARGYNLGMAGWAPHLALNLLQKGGKRLAGISGRNGVVVYTFIDNQVARVVGSVSWEGHDEDPYYQLEGGKPIQHGTFESGRWLTTVAYNVLRKSELAKFFSIDLTKIDDQQLELFAALINEMKIESRRKFGTDQFVLSVFPGERRYAKKLVPMIQKFGIKVFDYSSVDISSVLKGASNAFYQGNWHPTALGHRFYADLLYRDLRKEGFLDQL